jgi:predicted nucleic acid-binding protein
MDRYVLLDSGPLSLAVCRRGTKDVDGLRDRLAELEMAGVSVLIPAVIDYEVRRELVRVRATAKLKNLADMQRRFLILPVSGAAWFRAAEFWALSRRMGVPTGPDAGLEADAILAGCAATVGRPGDEVLIASSNVRHWSRFPGIDAREWTSLIP